MALTYLDKSKNKIFYNSKRIRLIVSCWICYIRMVMDIFLAPKAPVLYPWYKAKHPKRECYCSKRNSRRLFSEEWTFSVRFESIALASLIKGVACIFHEENVPKKQLRKRRRCESLVGFSPKFIFLVFPRNSFMKKNWRNADNWCSSSVKVCDDWYWAQLIRETRDCQTSRPH